MNKSGKKSNGIMNVDTPQMEQMRQAVVEQELSARSWRAYYEKMYYSMEAEKLEEPYKEYQERTKKRMEEEKKKRDEFLEALQKEIESKNEKDPAGEINLKAVDVPLSGTSGSSGTAGY